jgi:hypothetical protein
VTPDVSVQPLIQRLERIERKLNSSLELQLEIFELFIPESEPKKDEIDAIESSDELLTEEKLHGEE